MPDRDVADQIVLVTGGASGIGRAIVEAFAKQGARTAFSYLTSEADARSLEDATGAVGLRADLTQKDAARDIVAAVEARWGPITTLVANAGGIIRRSSILDCDLSLWNEAITLNMTTAFLSCQAVLPGMIAAGHGVIVTVSSLAAHNGGGFNAVHYGSAKGGLHTFTKGLAREVGPLGIRVNGVAPGLIATRFHDQHNTPEARRATVEQTPLRREGTAADVAGAVLYLASDQASFLAAEIIEINGGLGLF